MKKTKRVICAVFAVMMLVMAFPLSAGAAEEKTPSVLTELQGLYIDGKQFSVNDYPVDKSDEDMQVITVVESGFTNLTYSPSYRLFIYVYNPSCIQVTDADHSVQIGLNDQNLEKNYTFFGLKLLSRSEDYRFLKFMVIDSVTYGMAERAYKTQPYAEERVYDVVLLRLRTLGVLKEHRVKKTFFFKGIGNTLTCSTKDLNALDVELKFTNWISPNAGYLTDGSDASIYDHYEINTTYFMIPNDVYYSYDVLKSIKAGFAATHLTPIILTRPDDFDDTTKDAIIQGADIEIGGDVDVMDLWVSSGYYSGGIPFGWLYSESKNLHAIFSANNTPGFYAYDSLAYYFENLDDDFDYDDPDVAKGVVSAEELKAYFYERYNDPDYDNSKLWVSSEWKELTYNAVGYGVNSLWEMTTFNESLHNRDFFEKWMLKTFVENDSYTFQDFNTKASCIQVIENPSDYSAISVANYQAKADELFIGVSDVKDFSNFCQKAANENCVVVLLRFGFSDYRCYPVRDTFEISLNSGPMVALGVEKTAFLNVSLAHIVFEKAGEDHIVPVASTVGDSFGNLDGYGDSALTPEDVIDPVADAVEKGKKEWEEWLEKFLETLKTIGVITGIVFAVFVLLWIFFKFKPVKIKHEYPTDKKRHRERKK